MEIIVPETQEKIKFQIYEANDPAALLILAHGAGAGMTHPFMQDIAFLLKERNITVALFNFPYMEQGKKVPGSAKKNIQAWSAVATEFLKQYPNEKIYLGGKSYGGRMASHLLAENTMEDIRGLVYFGFPLHAPGRDGIDRAAHLPNIHAPQLFLQGTKDKLAKQDLIRNVVESLPESTLKFFEDADHSFHVPKRTGKTDRDVRAQLAVACQDWILRREELK